MSKTAVFNSQGNVAQYARKNLLINGDFSVWQRGTSIASGNKYAADRWYINGSSAVTTQIVNDSAAPVAYAQRITRDGAKIVRQCIELPANGVAGIFAVGQKLTLSGKVRSSVVEDVVISFGFADDSAGVGFVPTQPATLVPVSANVWVDVEIPVVVGTSPVAGNLAFNLDIQQADIGGSSTFDITALQLELGDTATAFEYVTPADQLARCQRYYYDRMYLGITGSSAIDFFYYFGTGSSTDRRLTIEFPVSLRGFPTMAYTVSNGTAGTPQGYSRQAATLRATGTAVNSAVGLTSFTADAEL